MSDYIIDGQYDLDQINIQIAGQEAGASETLGLLIDNVSS
jgi:hypothetical protein